MSSSPVTFRRFVGVLLACTLLLQPAFAIAQIVLDGSLGPAGVPPKAGANYLIGAGLGQTHDRNLFHSFSQFNIGAGERATFSGPMAIQNIISRVTGGSASHIDGLLRSTIPGANFFLLNPRGVLFGPGAALDIGGSFHVSTADYLRFADGNQFHASLARTSTLTVAPPAAFGFLGPAAPISISDSVLQVRNGQSLSVVGGDIQIVGGTLVAPGGRVSLAATGSAGEVVIRNASGQPTLSPEGFTRLGRVDVVSSLLDASGAGGGTIAIRAEDVAIDSSLLFADTQGALAGAPIGLDFALTGDLQITNSLLTTDTFGSGRAGNIEISAGFMVLDADTLIGSRPVPGTTGAGGDIRVRITGDAILDGASSIQTFTLGSGAGGTVVVEAGRLGLFGGSQINGLTLGHGLGGSVSVTARELLLIGSGGSGIFSQTEGAAPGGSLHVAAPQIVMDGGRIVTLGFGSGRAGDILVEGNTLTLTGGADVRSNAEGSGQGGAVTVNITDAVTLSGRDGTGDGSGVYTSALAEGAGGALRIFTGSLTILDGAMVRTEAQSSGRGGDIAIEARRLSLDRGGEISSISDGAGRGGEIAVIASESVSIGGPQPSGSGIFALAVGAGAGGGVLVRTPSLVLAGDGLVAAQTQGPADSGAVVIDVDRLTATGRSVIAGNTAGSGDAGGVRITARESITFTGEDGQPGDIRFIPTISSSQTGSGTGTPGPIAIVTPSLTLRDAAITASTASSAPAGDVTIDVARLTLADGGRIESRTNGTGASGRITVTASESVEVTTRFLGPDTSLSGIVVGTEGTGPGGQVAIRTPRLLLDYGFITANAFGAGRGGDISVDVGSLTILGGGQISSAALGSGSGGNLTVTASDAINISGALSADIRSGLLTTTRGPGDAGRITVVAPSVTMTDAGVISAQTFGSGRGNDIVLQVGRLDITGGSAIDNGTFGSGSGGTISISASDTIRVAGTKADGDSSGIVSGANDAGAAGQIDIVAPTVILDDHALVSVATSGQGQAGNISLRANTLLMAGEALVDSTSKGTAAGSGRAGDVTVDAGTVSITGGARIASNSQGPGAGGTIRLTASDSVTIAGSAAGSGAISSGMVSTAESAGAAGQVIISAPRVTLIGGVVATSTTGEGRAGDIQIRTGALSLQGGASIEGSTTGPGAGGTVSIDAGDALTVSASRIASTAASTGAGGSVEVQARRVQLTDDAQISATSTGAGDAGSIAIVAPLSFESRGSAVTTATTGSDGGNIALLVGGLVRLVDSQITATVQGGEGQGGNIVIGGLGSPFGEGAVVRFAGDPLGGPPAALTPTRFVILTNSQITANAFGGPGGRVDITADVLLADPNSAITASSTRGVQGTVSINAPTQEVSGTLGRLPEAILQAAALLRESCGARFAEQAPSTLVMLARDGVPPEPGGAAASPLFADERFAWLTPLPGMAMARPASPLVHLRCTK